ncbi:hypothetical protein DHD80_05835 [Gramella sp. AN32]|nr:hypothetical protein [Gramella sp. AN32]
MKCCFKFFLISLFLISCEKKQKEDPEPPHSFELRGREIKLNAEDSLNSGSTYLSVYSQIYSLSEHRTHDLTATISMRNINLQDTVYISKADYYDTHGNLISSFINENILLKPMETLEIVIEEVDKSGGTGANFVFDWQAKDNVHAPYFEAVMISTSGKQGLSFTTQGVKIK